MFLEGFFDGVGGFPFAFEVFGEVFLRPCVSDVAGGTCCSEEEQGKGEGARTYDMNPSLVIATVFDHQVGAFPVSVHPAIPVCLSGWNEGYAIEGPLSTEAVVDLFLRRGFQGLRI